MRAGSLRLGVAVVVLVGFQGALLADDTVIYRDSKSGKIIRREGRIMSETPAGLMIVSGLAGKKEFIPVTAIEDVRLDDEPLELIQARAQEAKQQWQKALDFYNRALSEAQRSKGKLVAPYVEFKILKLQVLLLDQQESSPLGRGQLASRLEQFHKKYPNAWQTVECLQLITELRLRDGLPVDDVLKELTQLRQQYSNQSELVGRIDLVEARALVQQAQGYLAKESSKAKEIYQQAHERLEKILQTARDPSLQQEILVNLVECKAALGRYKEADALLAKLEKEARDPRTKALLHLGRGDIYRLSNRWRDAMWEYLWVDVIYNQDRELAARALYWLVEVFRKLGDEQKAKSCQERLVTEYKDSVWAKRLAK